MTQSDIVGFKDKLPINAGQDGIDHHISLVLDLKFLGQGNMLTDHLIQLVGMIYQVLDVVGAHMQKGQVSISCIMEQRPPYQPVQVIDVPTSDTFQVEVNLATYPRQVLQNRI